MIRALVIFLLTTAPALSWEARFGAICELLYDDESTSVRLTYDPTIPEYSISVTGAQPWESGPFFAMQFDGPRQNFISTNRHVLSDGGQTVTVTDRGFGNVLNGLEFNDVATAYLGEQTASVPLEGAAPAVQEFRACTTAVGV
ncbi:MAG: hypothetical protein AAFY99_09505 [Pseudomonadota bacterium]